MFKLLGGCMYNKFLFLRDFQGKPEHKYKKYKKARKILSWIFFPLLTAAMVLMPVGYFLSLVHLAGVSSLVFTFGSMAWAPTYYVLTDVMRWDINNLGVSNVTYREFKKMEKSGELDFYKMLYEDYNKQIEAGNTAKLKYHPVYDDSFYEKYINGQAELKYDDQNLIVLKTDKKTTDNETEILTEKFAKNEIQTAKTSSKSIVKFDNDNDLTI